MFPAAIATSEGAVWNGSTDTLIACFTGLWLESRLSLGLYLISIQRLIAWPGCSRE
jgi:hypothetical protein